LFEVICLEIFFLINVISLADFLDPLAFFALTLAFSGLSGF